MTKTGTLCALLAMVLGGTALRAQTVEAGQIYKTASAAVVLIEAKGADGKVSKSGSGFLVSSDGKLLTNYHVVSHSKEATVRLANGDAYDTVEVLAIDKRKDIAFLKIKAVELPVLKLGRSASVEIGSAVYAIGSPLGLQNTLSNGLVSGIREMDGYRLFQISAPISHGSSGGPVFNAGGEVVGIATLTIDEGQNLNFAVPIDYARGMLTSSESSPLSSIYEPEPEPKKDAVEPAPGPPPKTGPATDAVSASRTLRMPDEMKQAAGIYLEKQINRWAPDDAQAVLGVPLRRRDSIDIATQKVNGEINAYSDPTGTFREVELNFESANKRLVAVYMYPWNMTWDQCKSLWGDDVNTTRKPDGTRIYNYKKRRLGVYVQKDGHVINYFVY